MKAYVIKNKEGKYRDKEGWLSNNLLDVDIFKDYELALSACLSDEKPVEITITEENLEKNQKAIECLEELNEKLTDIIIAETEDIWDFKFGQALERISASFGELLNNKIKELEENNDKAR